MERIEKRAFFARFPGIDISGDDMFFCLSLLRASLMAGVLLVVLAPRMNLLTMINIDVT